MNKLGFLETAVAAAGFSLFSGLAFGAEPIMPPPDKAAIARAEKQEAEARAYVLRHPEIFDRIEKRLLQETMKDSQYRSAEKDGRAVDRADLERRVANFNIFFSESWKKLKGDFYDDFGVHAELFWNMIFFASPTSRLFMDEVEFNRRIFSKYCSLYETLIKEHPESDAVKFFYAVTLDLKSTKINNQQPSTKFYLDAINSMTDKLPELKKKDIKSYNNAVQNIYTMIYFFTRAPPPHYLVRKKFTTLNLRGDPFEPSEQLLMKFLETVPLEDEKIKVCEIAYMHANIPNSRNYIFDETQYSILKEKGLLEEAGAYVLAKNLTDDQIILNYLETYFMERFMFSGMDLENLKTREKKADLKTHVKDALRGFYFVRNKKYNVNELADKFTDKIKQKPWKWMDKGISSESAKLAPGPLDFLYAIGNKP
ncbi:hypothetical protein KY311_04795 [Candidatus Woesearchaeota archaeon]|nr:hypothetical protein [Candidatus Woesearchaeota archaeon]MBW3017054.1 hypothetical protein [Candidatus Woesearchaeota archaeon]